MTKTIVSIIVVLILVGVGITIAGKNADAPTDIKENEVSNESIKGSIQSLFSKGKDITCTFEREDEFGRTEGTVYVSAGKLAGDFVFKDSDEVEFKTQIIQDNEYSYTWGLSPAGEMAIKMRVSEIESATTAESDNSEVITFNPDEEVDYTCNNWDKDDSKFTPPSDIVFIDMSFNLTENEESGEMSPETKCSTCDLIPDEKAKAQCRAAMGC